MSDRRMRDNNYIARYAIRLCNLNYYEIAEALGISPQALSLRFRREMSMKKQLDIARLAENIASERRV